LVRTKGVAHRRDVNEIRIVRMHPHAGDVTRVGQADLFPALSGVGRLPQAVAVRDVAADGLFTATDVDDRRVARRYAYRADRAAEKPVGHVSPRLAGIGGLPDAAATRAEVVRVALARDSFDGIGPSAPVGT